MRVLVVGSVRGAKDPQAAALIHQAGKELGACLAERGHTILVGSEDSDDIDPDVVNAAAAANPKSAIEVHLMSGAAECYAAFGQSGNVTNRPHRYKDWDVTVLEVLRNDADAVVALAGRVGVVQTGIAGWMMGRPVIPVASFGGGAQTVWGYGSGERDKFYFGALKDEEVDRLTGSWNSAGPRASAPFIVDLLERVAERSKIARTPKSLFAVVSSMVLLALIGWVAMLCLPLLNNLDCVSCASRPRQ
jgi:hypothetical protein